MPKEWKPIVRVGTPNVSPDRKGGDQLIVRLKTYPSADQAWLEYFSEFTKLNGLDAYYESSGMDGNGMWMRTDRDALERTIAAVDQGIENANERFEKNALPAIIAEEAQREREKADKAAQAAELAARVAKLARPEARDL